LHTELMISDKYFL